MEIMKNTDTVSFFENVANIISQARTFVGRTADLTMCSAYFEVGRMIVEEEQGGEARAKYGRKLLASLAAYLNANLGKGYSETTLRNARKFYQIYSPSIQQTLCAESGKQQTLSAEFALPRKSQTMFGELNPFRLSWSHYLVLMRMKNTDQRQFYEIEAIDGQWTLDRLKTEYNGSLYERLALSRDKEEIMRLSREGQTMEKPRDILKSPLILEFYGLEEKPTYSEDDLESAICDNLEKFLLELGKGFLFEARQKRFSFDEKSFWVDLVFYNRLLQCYVLIDLKRGEIHHQDLGQMQMYVHYFDRYVVKDFEKPTIGILLCEDKSDSIVELTLPEGENIYASEYSLYLPEKAVLQRKLAEWVQEFEDKKELISLQEDIIDLPEGGDSE
jgi:predicted nuclease of restriction endonuclease-like (RecB) superfamily